MTHDVLHILGTGRAEGASIARIVGMLARNMGTHGYRVHALFLDGEGPVADELRRQGIPVLVLNWTQGARDPSGAWEFYRSLKGKHFSIIHQHFGGRSTSFLARRTTGAKLVIHWWARFEGSAPPAGSLPAADAVLTPSQAMADLIAWAQPRVVYPGLPSDGIGRSDERAPAGGRARTIGTAARLVPIKGIVTPIRAMKLLRDQFPELRLEIAGSGPEQLALEKEADSIGVNDRVTFLGWQPDLKPLMARWDVFVLPSLEEPLPIVGLEAMAAGLPVVCSAVDGLPELIQDGISGFLVPPSDPKALADRIRALVLDVELLKSMGAAGRERVREHFSAEQMCTVVAQIYDDLLALPAATGLGRQIRSAGLRAPSGANG